MQPALIWTLGSERPVADLPHPVGREQLARGDGRWEIELGFGKGRYLLRRASAEPDARFLGVEIASQYYRLARDRAERDRLANLTLIRGEAVAQHRSVIMEYYVQSRDELTKRKVDPLGLVYYTDHWNLIAYDHLRDSIRNYRLDSIQSMFVLSERFAPPEGFDLEEHLKERGESPANVRIVIRFAAQVYQWARPSIPAEIEEERPRGEHVSRL